MTYPKLHERSVQYKLVGNEMVLSVGLRRNRQREMTMPIIEWCREQKDYCLDAPDRIPAGYCFNRISDCRPFAPRSEQIEAGVVHRETGPLVFRTEDLYVDPANDPTVTKISLEQFKQLPVIFRSSDLLPDGKYVIDSVRKSVIEDRRDTFGVVIYRDGVQLRIEQWCIDRTI